ncbi:hypothetical protein JOE58_002348 [Curtobacterium luteum]|uniref:Uncharacterized protein n=1 Tax=Curtobacterium luteum TaxID=33881 RepID=A0A8H9G7Q8_9MICO|nr:MULTISPECIES: hypothetical protein [Curtobacterium]MBM7803097.1 hypothetical protein [Curtobacterium luteum]NUU50748.1 hypothetical protein [Curtobacterium luteum]GGK94004.1 hypothetical protein GCM10009769_10060 [Curtobacterium luteum]
MTDTLSVPTFRLATATRPAVPHRASRRGLDDHGLAPAWMRAVGAVLLLGGLALSAAVLGWPGDAPEASLLVPGLVGVVAGFLLLVARTGLTVTDEHVTVRFRPLPPRRIARRRIADVRLVEADASTYGGIGLRRARGVRALLLTPGTGVEITDDRGRVTFVRTARPEAAYRALAA